MQNYKILIAEDDEVIFLYLQIILRNSGYSIVHAKNGREAVDFCRSEMIDLILMDIKMPIMNGLDAIKEIRTFNKSVPIIVQSAYTSDENKEASILFGGNDFITKPINKGELFEKIEKFLNIK
jgi:CheY-like chemotaxis protein